MSVCALELEDVPGFLGLQDQLVEHHVRLTQLIYPKVCFRDWQLCIQGNPDVVDNPCGRQRQLERIVRGDWPTRLHVLKAVCHPYGCKPSLVGYIMYEVHGGPGRPRARGVQRQEAPWVHVLQVFVKPAHRCSGCGGLLFQGMLARLSPQERINIKLEVLDLNSLAIAWYRSLGFATHALTSKFLGDRQSAQVVVYQGMLCCRVNEVNLATSAGLPEQETSSKNPEQHLAVPSLSSASPVLFKNEVLQEKVLIYFPDRPGQHEVRIVGYDRFSKWHFIGLSLENGEVRKEKIDLSQLYRDGRVQFKRYFSLMQRDSELLRRARASCRKRKLEELASQVCIETRSKRRCCQGDVQASGL